MTVYGIAHLSITDRTSYERYTEQFMPVLQQYNGTLLAADDQPRVVEETCHSGKVIVLSFEDEAGFDRWYNSPEYQAILGDRLAGANGPVLLARGIRRSR